ncbi:MAG: alpha/beta hydrolase [Bacteroidota bacterium]
MKRIFSYTILTSLFFGMYTLLSAQLSLQDTSFTGESGVEVKAQIGYLEVPENRENPESSMISVKFVKLKSTPPNPGAPLIYLEGGPGSSCSWQASNPYFLDNWIPYLELGDVILLDQRGTGEASQRLTYIWMKEIPEDVFQTGEAAKNHFDKIEKEALIAFEERGIDLKGYTTVQNAQDVDALRKALGYDKVSIMGFSYGSHLGLSYIRQFGDKIENAVLIGTEGPNHTFKLPLAMDKQLRKLSLMAKADPKISKHIPDLVELYKEVIAQLKAEPAVVTVRNPISQKDIPVKIGPFGLQAVMFIDMGDASDLPVFPRLLYSIKQKDYSLLEWFIRKRYNMVLGTQGMSTTMDYASGASKDRTLRIQEEIKESLFADINNVQFYAPDQREGNWDLGEEFRSPIISNVRTLFLSGTLDFNTPPYQAEEVRWGFSNSSHIIVKNAGHEQIIRHPMAQENVIKFLKGESVDEVALAYPDLEFIPVVGEAEGHPSLE